MRVLVLSDTHRHLEQMRWAIAQAGQVEYIFHLGDHITDAAQISKYTQAKVVCVKGNCDYSGPAEQEVFLEGHKILLTHGHQHAVKYSLHRLSSFAQEKEADAVLFGHTHIPCTEYANGRLLYNPGSVGEPRGGKPTFGILLVTRDGIFPRTPVLQPPAPEKDFL